MSPSPRIEDVSTRHPAEIPMRRLWFGLLAAPAVWVAQGGLGWFFGERICTTMSVGAVRTVVGIISLAAIATAGAALAVARDSWRRTSPHPDIRSVEAWDRVEFMSVGGVLVSSIFILGIVWAGLSSVFINVCGGMR